MYSLKNFNQTKRFFEGIGTNFGFQQSKFISGSKKGVLATNQVNVNTVTSDEKSLEVKSSANVNKREEISDVLESKISFGINLGNEEKNGVLVGKFLQESQKKDPFGVNDHLKVVAFQSESLLPRQPKWSGFPEVLMNAEPFESIPGPTLFNKFFCAVDATTRQMTVSCLIKMFQKGSSGPFTRFGPVVKMPELLGGKIVLINRPQHITEMYDQEDGRPIRSILDSVEKHRSRRRGSFGDHLWLLNLSEKKEEKELRLGTLPIKEAKDYFSQITNFAESMVNKVRSLQCEPPIDFTPEITKWSLDCFCLITFDKCFGFLATEKAIWSPELSMLHKSIEKATESLCKCEAGFQFWRFTDTSNWMKLDEACNTIERIISENLRKMYLRFSKKTSSSIQKLTPLEHIILTESIPSEDVVTIILDLMLIGVNTAKSALSFLLYHLAENAQAQRLLFEELKGVLPTKNSDLMCHQLNSLKYLQACLKESLRLKLPLPILTRVLSTDIALSNYRIPKGTYVIMAAQIECLKEKNFETPDEFLPERWLQSSDCHPFVSIPIGRAPRSYVEATELAIWTCIAKLVRNFKIEYDYEKIGATNTAISFPDKPLRLRFTERQE